MASDKSKRRVKPGDGSALPPYRWWQLLNRTLFHLVLPGAGGAAERWSVDTRLWGDNDDGEVRARLYRDGINVFQSKLPAEFEVPGGNIQIAASSFGLRRAHYVSDAGIERQLQPDPASAEGRRARLQRNNPGVSRAIGVLSILILIVALVLGVPQLIETITSIPVVADVVGTFTSPIHLPAWFNTTLVIAALAASTERALRLRYHWLLDGGVFEGEE